MKPESFSSRLLENTPLSVENVQKEEQHRKQMLEAHGLNEQSREILEKIDTYFKEHPRSSLLSHWEIGKKNIQGLLQKPSEGIHGSLEKQNNTLLLEMYLGLLTEIEKMLTTPTTLSMKKIQSIFESSPKKLQRDLEKLQRAA